MSNIIRPLDIKDWDDVKYIYQQGIDTNIATFQTAYPPWEEWDISHLGNCRFVYVLDGRVSGWVMLSAVSNRCAYAGVAEVSIYIANDAKRKGIGTSLLQKVIQASEECGIWTLQSSIQQGNTASIGLHTKCGFREVGYRERIAKDKLGTWKNTVLMERRSESDRFN